MEDCIGLQADLLPTGSISFGRFETETLSWERRSSFSHNRYLEEVEKCSTPGSVTQKKAYFEAHFKKKGCLPYASLDDQNGFESQIPDNDIEDHMSYMERYLDHGNKEQKQFVWHDKVIEIPDEDEKGILEDRQHIQFSFFDEKPALSNDSKHDVVEKTNQQIRFNWCDEEPIVSNEYEHDMKEHEQETLSPKHSLDAAPCNIEKGLDMSTKLLEQNEQAQVQCTDDSLTSDKDRCCETIQQEVGSGAGALKKLEKKEMPSKGLTLEKSTSSALKKPPAISPRLSAELNLSKSKPRTSMPVARSPIMTSSGKDSPSSPASATRRMNRTENEKMKRDKQLPIKFPSNGISESNNLESEGFGNLKVRVRHEAKSEKDQLPRRSGIIAKSIYEKHDVDLQPSRSRSQMSISSNKINIMKSNAVLNFRSDESAEKSKEFFRMLEEKQNTQESEMNLAQARAQVEGEDEIKQPQRSLNFKATSMRAFYRETMIRNKGIATQLKSMNLRSSSASPRCKPLLNDKPQQINHKSIPLSKSTSSTQKNYPMSPTGNFGSSKLKAASSCELKGNNTASGPSKKIDPAQKEGRSKATTAQRRPGDSKMKKAEGMGSVRRPGMEKTVRM